MYWLAIGGGVWVDMVLEGFLLRFEDVIGKWKLCRRPGRFGARYVFHLFILRYGVGTIKFCVVWQVGQ